MLPLAYSYEHPILLFYCSHIYFCVVQVSDKSSLYKLCKITQNNKTILYHETVNSLISLMVCRHFSDVILSHMR